MSEPFALSFGIKAVQEVEHDGQSGLLLSGYATRFGEVDRSGEHMTRAALQDLSDTWAAEPAPLVLLEHGLSDLGNRRIGKAIEHRIDEEGLHVSVFVPKEPGWKDQRAVKKFREVYSALKDGVLRGFSVGGSYTRDAAGAIKRWSMLELSVVSKPCLPSATFTVGAKALAEAYGAVPSILDVTEPAAKGSPMAERDWRPASPDPAAFTSSGAGASVVPLSVPAGNVTVSAPVVAAQGGWTLSYGSGANTVVPLSQTAGLLSQTVTLPGAAGPGPLEGGAKAAAKREPDGADHPPSHYLVVEDENKANTFHLQVKNAQGAYDRKLCAQAYAALTSNFRGNPYSGPNKQAALQKLRAIYKSQGWEWPADSGGESKSGKKASVLRDGLAFLHEFERGQKAGRRHSAATLAAVKVVIDMLEQHFGLADADDESAGVDDAAVAR